MTNEQHKIVFDIYLLFLKGKITKAQLKAIGLSQNQLEKWARDQLKEAGL